MEFIKNKKRKIEDKVSLSHLNIIKLCSSSSYSRYSKRDLWHFNSHKEVFNSNLKNLEFCIYEMPIGSIIVYNSKKYKILGFLENVGPGGKYGSMECQEIFSSKKVLIDSTDNALYCEENFKKYK